MGACSVAVQMKGNRLKLSPRPVVVLWGYLCFTNCNCVVFFRSSETQTQPWCSFCTVFVPLPADRCYWATDSPLWSLIKFIDLLWLLFLSSRTIRKVSHYRPIIDQAGIHSAALVQWRKTDTKECRNSTCTETMFLKNSNNLSQLLALTCKTLTSGIPILQPPLRKSVPFKSDV